MEQVQEQREPQKIRTSYELITNWLDVGYTLNLSNNAISLMTQLLRFYNPLKKYVFPHQKTLAIRTNTSLASVKRGLNELIKSHLIIKVRKKSGNVYAFTGSLFELLNSSICTVQTAQFEPCHDHEQIKEPNKTTNMHVVFPNKEVITTEPKEREQEHKTMPVLVSKGKGKITLDDIPQIVKDKARNPIAYWLSLSVEVREQYKQEQQEIDRQQQIKEENEKFRQNLKEQKELEEKQIAEEMQKPLTQRFSRANAVKMCRNFRRLPMHATNKMLQDLIVAFEIEEKELL